MVAAAVKAHAPLAELPRVMSHKEVSKGLLRGSFKTGVPLIALV